MKKSFDVWLVTAPTRDLEANLRSPRNAMEAARIREELRNRSGGLPDTGTMELFPKRTDDRKQKTAIIAAALLCLTTLAIAAPRRPIKDAYLQNDLDANNHKIINLDLSGTNLVPSTRSISTTAPLTGGGDFSADRTLSIANAAADGTTKGAATFSANDFNAVSGVISIDYANAQKASATLNGILSITDWIIFNGKENVLTFSQSLSRTSNTITLQNDAASPGASKYYGTDSGGTKGYFALSSGGDFSSNTSSSVDGELVLFSGTGGKTGKRATGTGVAHVASGVYSASAVMESDINLADNTTDNASTSAHGFVKKLDNNAAHYMDGTGNWSTPAGSGGAGYWDSFVTVTGSDVTTTNTTATDVTGLTAAALANNIYEIEAIVRVNSSSAAGMQVGVNYSAAGASLNASAMGPGSATGTIANLGTLGSPAVVTTQNNVDGVAVIRGFVITGANAGNITVQHAKVTSGTSTVRLGSVLKVKKM